jgi:hypothetical protein
MIAHATEEHIASSVTSRNRRTAGSGVATRSGTRCSVLLQWQMWYRATHINRETVFSVGSAPSLYHSTDQVEFSWWSGVAWWMTETSYCQLGREAVNTEFERSPALEAATRQRLVKTADWEDLVRAVVNCRMCLQFFFGRRSPQITEI